MAIGEVRVSETLDGLVVTPREIREVHGLSALLRDTLPTTQLRRRAGSFHLGVTDAECLLNLSAQTRELQWSPEAVRFVVNRQQARRLHPRLLKEVGALRSAGKEAAQRYLQDAEGLEVLDGHQIVNVAAMTLPEGFGLCVFDEQGAGKTVTLIFAFDVLVDRDEADFALIVAPKLDFCPFLRPGTCVFPGVFECWRVFATPGPTSGAQEKARNAVFPAFFATRPGKKGKSRAKSMVPEWPCDFERFKGDLYQVAVASGNPRKKWDALTSGADVVVTNFETAVAMEAELRNLLRRRPSRAVLVVDESFYAKNLEARRTQALRRLREWCGRAFVLCGTPAPNAPQDLVQQFNIVDFGLTFDGVDVPDDREQARPVVQRTIEERGLYVRHLKADVLPDLPAKQFHRVLVPLQPDQQRLYAGALRDLILDLRATDDQTFQRELASFFARRSALLQICSNPVSVVAGYSETPAKLLALDGLLEEAIVRRGEKVVLWSFYTASIDAVMDRFDQYGAIRYDGSVADVADRREAVRRFQEDNTTMLFVGNPAAAGAGLTLHRARLAVYESMSNQAAHYLQSLDRIHRRGQTRDVEYVILLCDETIELAEYERLTEKERAGQQLLGDRVDPPITRLALLQEAEDAARLLGMFQA